MLSIGKIADVSYYFSRVADDIQHYLSLEGEAPGVWTGAVAEELGLAGVADPEVFGRILAGCDPHTGETLGVSAKRRLLGFDLCFRAPKSVSVLAGLGDPDTVAVTHRCHHEAVSEALAFMERHG